MSLDLLLEFIPSWAQVAEMQPGLARITTGAAHVSGQPLRVYNLTVTDIQSTVDVREHHEERILPKICVQRHMNGDGSFCIGLGAQNSVSDHASAIRWWNMLLEYLRCQDIAHITRRWPPNRGLSHGAAATIQIEAERLADKMGILTKYREAVEYGEEWPPQGMEMCDDLAQLIALESRRRAADAAFLDWFIVDCCGTMDHCPLS